MRFILFIAYGFGLGKIPLIPATFGSLIGILLFLLISFNHILYLIITISLTLLGIKIAGIAERSSKIKDDKRIVIDEIVGFLITMINIPNDIFYVVLGFFIFRCLDILKPFPIYYFQRLNGGLGIMMDDVLAGIYGCIILHILKFILSK